MARSGRATGASGRRWRQRAHRIELAVFRLAVLRLKVVDAATGGAVPTGRLVARYFGYFVSMIPLFLGFIWVGIDSKKQGWHDKMAGTVVVRTTHKEPVRFEGQA